MDVLDFKNFRTNLIQKLPSNSFALIASGSEQIRNNDVDYPFRATSDFLYLTGLNEPDSVLLLLGSSLAEKLAAEDFACGQEVIFLRAKDKTQELWEGRRLGVDAAPESLSLDRAFAITELDELLPRFLAQASEVYFSFAELDYWSLKFADNFKSLKKQNRLGKGAPAKLADLDPLLHKMRTFKTPEEVAIMRQAAQVSVAGHKAAMRAAQSAEFEYQIQAELEAEFMRLGSARVAFSSIVAAGENACILHYTDNQDSLNRSDLVLVDAGAEFQGYAGDITHTFPLSGKFLPEQAEIYELVLAAQEAAKREVRPNNSIAAMHQASVAVISQGLLDLGLLEGSLDEVIANQSYREFFMHGTGHFLGRDVHDVGVYKVAGESCDFAVGMVVTVEPGIYVPANHPSKWAGIGVRIEDNLLVTEQGNEVLTQGLPRSVAEIEEWMQK